MKKLKVMTVVGTRPEIIRLSRVLSALDASEAVEHIIVHTGQNYDYELNQIFLKIWDFVNRIIFWKQQVKQQQKRWGIF
jgi:UDP-N-acetylglucosamine 2-epimerase